MTAIMTLFRETACYLDHAQGMNRVTASGRCCSAARSAKPHTMLQISVCWSSPRQRLTCLFSYVALCRSNRFARRGRRQEQSSMPKKRRRRSENSKGVGMLAATKSAGGEKGHQQQAEGGEKGAKAEIIGGAVPMAAAAVG